MSGTDFATGATEHLREYTVPTVLGPAKVTHGVLNDAAKVAYSTGQCHALALAMHERGYKLGAVVEKPYEGDWHDPDEDEHEEPEPSHAGLGDLAGAHHFFAYDPHSPAHGIDIAGRRPISEIVRGFDTHREHYGGEDNLTHSEVDPGTIHYMTQGPVQLFSTPHMTAARSMARKLAPKVRSPRR